MLRLLRAEWIKMWGRSADRYVIAGLLAIAALAPVVMTLSHLADPAHNRAALLYLRFPISLDSGVGAMSAIGSLLAIFLAVSTLGSEYADGTWKLIVPRRAARTGLIAAKLTVAFASAALTAVLAIAIWAAAGAVCLGSLLRADVTGDAPGTIWSTVTVPLIVLLLRMLLVSAIAAVASIAARSSLVGFGAGLIVPSLLDLMTYAGNARVMPNAHLANLRVQFLQWEPASRPIRAAYDMHTGAAVSLLVVLGTVAALAALTALLFERQELG